MVSAEAARNVVGIIGNVISFGLFLSPCLTFYRIIKNKSVGEFHVYPYLSTVLNCVFWLLYGLPFVHPNSILVVTINPVGLAIELIYICSKQGKEKGGLLSLRECCLHCRGVTGVPTGFSRPQEKNSLLYDIEHVADNSKGENSSLVVVKNQ